MTPDDATAAAGGRPVAVLIGPPGSGKTTVGRALADLLGAALTDTDAVVEAETGKAISDIFVDDGEPAFRALERAAVAAALARHSGVVALGGGAPMDPATQDLLAGHSVVFLDVGIADAAKRVGFDQSRPLLAVNPRASWTALMNQRRPTYEALAAHRVDTAGRTPADIAAEIAGLLAGPGGGEPAGPASGDGGEPIIVPVGTAYEVVLGRGVLGRTAETVPDTARRALVVHGGRLPHVVGPVLAALEARGLAVVEGVVPDAEAAKTVEVAADLWARLGQHSFTRTDVVVGVGGGTVTDLAGFVAASWLRGVPFVNVPTTVLAMVDAAVGGKTGINTAEGKNLVGAFYEPLGVICDIDVLATLPEADFAAGMAEVVKAGFIDDPTILDLIDADPGSARRVGPATVELIERAIAMKAAVVTQDLRESGLREILNYGHTLGHALEQHSGYTMRHGEAVAIGMVFAAELAHRSGLIDAALLQRHRDTLALVGLPTTLTGPPLTDLLGAMGRDKKARGTTLRFVALEGLAAPTRLVGPEPELLAQAYAALTG